jgi:hypothetical protein
LAALKTKEGQVLFVYKTIQNPFLQAVSTNRGIAITLSGLTQTTLT